jgi:cysteine synthase A
MGRLMGVEGIGAGPSTGANIAACLRIATTSPEPLVLLTVAYDRVNDYLDLL